MTLDVSEPQVLAYYGADPHVRWHHRLLLARVSPGRWVASSPDFDLEILDLNTQRHRILSRRSPLPQDVINDVYIFDPISKRDLEKLKREAKTMALVLGDGEVTGEEERAWIFSDPSSEHLGKLVGHDKLQSAVTLGDRGLIEHEGKIEGISEVSVAEVGSIVEQIKGTQGDLRVLGLHVGADKKRLLLFKDAFPLFKESTFSDWVFTGPRAVKEFLGSIYESGTDLGRLPPPVGEEQQCQPALLRMPRAPKPHGEPPPCGDPRPVGCYVSDVHGAFGSPSYLVGSGS